MQVPTQIKRLGTSGLEISWQDGTNYTLSSKTLRDNCQAADSRMKRGDDSHDKPLGGARPALAVLKHSIDEELRLDKIEAVGNYAIRILWGDGHDSGIYSYELLYELCQSGTTS